ncbi:MAG: acetate kinase [Candidatus Omnitrophota bacterium]
MKILVINSGSSSIKYQLFDMRDSSPMCKGMIERIGSDNSMHTYQKHRYKPMMLRVDAQDHQQAVKYIFDIITNPASGVIESNRQISGIGHRVVHGAEAFTEPTLINEKVLATIEKFTGLAPLHNPPALSSISACRIFAKNIPQVAVFDTAFHQTIEPEAHIYGIPYGLYEELGIRKYGFHGSSHKFVAMEAAKRLKCSLNRLKLITCHLGNGCSITAVKNGVSKDTSMGFTPLEGLLMGTRCGDIDPAVILYIMQKKGFGIKQMSILLNRDSGLLGISGISNDMRDVLTAARAGKKRARLAIDVFLYRLKKYIGAYTASMDGVDAVVLTAGIGENMPLIKERIIKDLRVFLKKFNARVLVIPTNEELMIAQETAQLISRRRR